MYYDFYTEMLSLAAIGTLFALSVFVFLANKKSQTNQIFSLFSAGFGIWCLGVWKMSTVTTLPEAVQWVKILNLGSVSVPVFFVQLNMLLTERPISKIFKYAIYGSALVFLFFSSVTNLFTSEIIHTSYGYFALPGIIYHIYSLFFLFCMGYGIGILIRAILRASVNKRNQLFYALIAFLIGITGGAVSFLPLFKIYVYPIWNLTSIICGLILAYAIVKQRLMDIKVIISKGTARLITYFIFGGIYLGLSAFYFNIIEGRLDPLFTAFTIAYVILVAESFQPTRLSIQTTADKLFLRGKYDYYLELDNLGKKLVHCVEMEDLLAILQQAFTEVLEVRNPKLFILSPSGDRFMGFSLIDGQPLLESVPADSPLIRYFFLENENIQKGRRGPIRVEDIFKGLNAEMIIPCPFRQKIVGLIAIGPKLTEEVFTRDDIRLTNNIGSQTGSALERIKAYEDLRAEVASARQQLEISSRLSSLGTLAAGLTHEIRNPLAVIQSKLELLPNKIDDREYLLNLQEILPRNIDRIVELINRMLSFARPEKKKIEKIKISKLVNEVIDLIDGEASRHDVKIEKQFNEGLVLEGDYNRLSQVFLNIMLNAIQAMPKGGTLKILTQENHGGAEVLMSDTGVGIAPENLDKIFDPFYTTRSTGVGLGLSISRTIVDEHGGKIIVSSVVGQGTTFKVSLPPSFPKVL